MNFLVARLEGLLDTLRYPESSRTTSLPEDFLAQARLELDHLLPKVQALTSRREKLLAEQVTLPHYEATLRKLLPIIPPSAHEPGNSCVGVLVNREHTGVLNSVCKRILESSAGRAEVVASDVDLSTRAMLIVFPIEYMGEIEALLGREDVSRCAYRPSSVRGRPTWS